MGAVCTHHDHGVIYQVEHLVLPTHGLNVNLSSAEALERSKKDLFLLLVSRQYVFKSVNSFIELHICHMLFRCIKNCTCCDATKRVILMQTNAATYIKHNEVYSNANKLVLPSSAFKEG